MSKVLIDVLVDEVIAGTSIIVEKVIYLKDLTESLYYIQRNWHPENPLIRIHEPAEKCAEELRHLVGTGKFTVDIDDYTWEMRKRDQTADTREFKIVI